MSKILVTGGSGFIGTNLVDYLVCKKHEVVNFDILEPRNKAYLNNWTKGDVLNKKELEECFDNFLPEFVVHLAARTDLDEKQSIEGYSANTIGVENMIELINKSKTVKRTIYASSRMVCNINYIPVTFDDYCPPNLYGESKVIGEKLVKEYAKHNYIIVRPTSIWGPFFEIPYKTFFDTIRSGMFFLPKNHNPKKSFGFVLNSVFQIEKLMFFESTLIEKNYYLTDYPAIDIDKWSKLIAISFKKNPPKKISIQILKIVAYVGDFIQTLGWKNPPLTTFRLTNLITNMIYDTKNLEKICGELPFSLEQGVEITVDWISFK